MSSCFYTFGYYFLVSLIFTSAEVAIRVPANGSFRVHIFPKPLNNAINCTLTNPQNVVTVIPLICDDDSENPTDKIQPLGNDQCGAKVHDVASRGDSGRWTLTVSNGEESVSKVYRITVSSWSEPSNLTSTAALGDTRVTLLCGPSSNMLYCEFRDPSGNLVELNHRQRCQTQIDVVKVNHFGVWTCTVGIIGGATEAYLTHTLIDRGSSEAAVIFAMNTSLGTMMSWQVEGLSSTALWCRAIAPNNESFLIAPGMEGENYSSVSTDYGENMCGILLNGEFPEYYHGIWRLEIGVNARRAMGGFILMPEGKIPGPNDSNSTKRESHVDEINVMARDSFSVSCQTQYSASYCWIGGPHGQIFTPAENLTVGSCSQRINGSNVAEHDGYWTCNMAYVDGAQEEQFVTKVTVIENLYQVENSEIIVTKGDRTVISCRYMFEYPMQYCRFIKPDGTGLNLSPNMEQFDRYSYEGRGLEYGDCGLVISSVEETDLGEWKCATRMVSQLWAVEESDTCILRAPELTETNAPGYSIYAIEASIGAFVVILAILVVAGSVIVMKKNKKRRTSQASSIVKCEI